MAKRKKKKEPEKHQVWIIWGKDDIDAFQNDGDLSVVREYTYNTAEELTAFMDGVEAASGWPDFEQLDESPFRHQGVECAYCDKVIEVENDGESTPQGSMHKSCASQHESEHPEEW